MTICLALDISLRATGFAFDRQGGGRPLTGTWSVPASSACHGEAGLAFMRWLRSQVGAVGPDLIAIEAPLVPLGSTWKLKTTKHTVVSLTGLFYVANVVAAERCIPVVAEEPQPIRQHFCGTRHAGKEGVQARCRQLGWTFANDNESDALALLDWAKSNKSSGYARATAEALGRMAGAGA